MADDEFASFRSIKRGDFDERLANAQRLKDEGNELLNAGDFEDALNKYVEGLYQLEFHERALSMMRQRQDAAPMLQQLTALQVPLLLNSVLCELRMNPEEQVRRLVTAERRCEEVLRVQPENAKALFRKAQLHGRAGEYDEARRMLESLCRQQPQERAFRAELASVVARNRQARRETKAFWSEALDRLDVDNHKQSPKGAVDLEGGIDSGGGAVEQDLSGWATMLQSRPLAPVAAALAAILSHLCRLVLWFRVHVLRSEHVKL